MTETVWTLDTPDGFKIYGLLNTDPKKKNTKAILHVHGLTGSQTDYCAVMLAHNMPKHGYDVIRINLYHWNEGARSLIGCTLKEHSMDIDLAIKYFKKKYKQLFATGHSYGGPSLMLSKINEFSAVSLWDPSYAPAEIWNKKDYLKVGKYYIYPHDSNFTIGEAFMDEALAFDRTRARKLAAKCTAPLQVIYCDKDSVWVHKGESFHTFAKGPTDEKTTTKSQHAFYEEGAMRWLLTQTRKWFNQF